MKPICKELQNHLHWTHSLQMCGWCQYRPLKLFSNKSSRAISRSLWLFPEKITNTCVHTYYNIKHLYT